MINGATETRISDPVRGPCGRRLEAARHLVLALRAGLEVLQSVLDAVLDALVVAGLKMQAVIVRGRAPVATVEHFITTKEDRGGDRVTLILGELDHNGLRHHR